MPAEVIYHLTRTSNLRSIERNGLRPRGQRKGSFRNDPGLASNPEMVYFAASGTTGGYALIDALSRATKGVTFTLFRVPLALLDEESLYPDEDFLSQRLGRSVWAPSAMHDDVLEHQHLWRESLRTGSHTDAIGGSVAHRGIVPWGTLTAMSPVAVPRLNDPLARAWQSGPWFDLLRAEQEAGCS
jgi:hypothetical protein